MLQTTEMRMFRHINGVALRNREEGREGEIDR